MIFEPRYSDYEDRVRQSFRDQPLMSVMFGAVASSVAPGLVEIKVDVRSDMLQPRGNVHGVIASAVADSSAGYAAQTLIAENADIVTVEYKINFLAPGIGSSIRGIGKVLRPGRTLFVCSADVYAEDDTNSILFAHMVTTMMSVPV